MKFDREKVSSLLGHTEVRFTRSDEGQSPFSVIASPQGITQHGNIFLGSIDELGEYIQTLDLAWSEHIKLRPKIYSPTEH